MTDGFTKIEATLLDALHRERALLRQRDLLNGILLHEMANAVTCITGAVEIMRRSAEDEKLRDFALGRMGDGAHTLTDLLAGVRWMIGVETVPPTRQQLDLAAFVRQVAVDPATAGNRAGGRIRVEATADFRATEVCVPLLRHALSNLVRNALAYSPPQSKVYLKIAQTRHGVCIHVRNQGRKLPGTFGKAAFEPGRKPGGGGMGFGLYIVRTCMRRSGGEVVYGSTDAGTVFSLLLERPPTDEPPHAMFAAAEAESA